MKNKTQMTSAALILAATAGFAAAGSLDLDRAYAAELKADAGARSALNQGNLGNVEVSVGVRFGYAYNSADGHTNSDDDTTMGFQFSEVEVALEGDVTDNMHARISFDFGPDDTAPSGSGGASTLEDAYVDWAVNDDFTLRVGQFIPAFSSEASTSEFNTMNAHRSVTHEYVGNVSWTQGVQATFAGDTWKFSVGFNDGPNTGSTSFNSSLEADYAINARFDLFSDSANDRFADQTSWRGSETGWRIGAGIVFGTYAKTNLAIPAFESEDFFYTVDGAYEGDGWAVRAAFYGFKTDPNNGVGHENFGFELGGSIFLSDQWEAFGRWDVLLLDDDAGAGETTGEDTFNFIAVGANYYFVPESHAAKFTLELGVSLDETGDITSISGDPGVGAFGAGNSTAFFQEQTGEDGQIMISGTMQWMF